MALFQTSRELAARVEKDAQKHPNTFRRATWWAALWLTLLSLLWVGFEEVSGQNHIYEGGDLAIAHRMFENDCAKCHTTWAPLQRLVSFDLGGKIHSVTNEACSSCHPGYEHHQTQKPSNADINCSFCHLEHVGDHDLKRLTDSACTACHRHLDQHFTAQGDLTAASFSKEVSGFSEPDGHPEFAFRRLNSETATSENKDIGAIHKIRQVLESVDVGGKQQWRDKAKIKFNHAKHLEVLTDKDGKPNFAILERLGLDASGMLNGVDPHAITDGSQACNLCHKTDADGRYMLSINFEQHCHQCHKLYFDGEREVPHESPEIVRGFLTDHFSLAALRSPERLQVEDSERQLPGRQRPRLTKVEAESVAQQVAQSEADLQKLLTAAESLAGRRELGVKSTCVKCHMIEAGSSDVAKATGEKAASSKNALAQWSIVKPNIPSRWQSHSVFSHKGHQMLNCAECHGLASQDDNASRAELPQPSVFHSRATGDVLLPGINLCRKCHSDAPAIATGGLGSRTFGARSGCVECHDYHSHGQQFFVGHKNPVLQSSEVPLNALLKGRNNEAGAK